MPKVTLGKSCFYKDGPMEEVFFYVSDGNKRYVMGNGQERYGRPRDNCNLYNVISEINEAAQTAFNAFDATSFSSSQEAMKKINENVATGAYAYDENKVSVELDKYLKKEKKIEDAWNFEYCLRDVELVSTRAIKEMPENIKERCLAYVRDVINENISPSGKKVKSIDGRRSFSEKLLGKNSIREFREGFFHNLTHSISRLKGTPYISKVYQLYEAGFPQEVDIKAQKTANETTRREIYSLFDQKREDALRTEMLKRYASERIKGAMQLKYYNETGDISIFLNEKEQAEFEKMSFAELKEKYDTELVTTHKGAALATLKLHQEKKTGGNLAQSLEEYNGLINKAKSDVNFDINIRRYIFDEIKKDYQKFAPNDKAYKDIVENLAPAKYEIATINEYVKVIKEKEGELPKVVVDKINKIKDIQVQFTNDSNPIITGKANQSDIEKAKARITGKKNEETVKQAIKRVREKHEEGKKTGENVSGVVLADDIAERLKEGFELPTDKEKREMIVKNLRKKRVISKDTQKIKGKVLKER